MKAKRNFIVILVSNILNKRQIFKLFVETATTISAMFVTKYLLAMMA